MSESQIHTVRKICPGIRDSLHQQPEDNNIRLISTHQTIRHSFIDGGEWKGWASIRSHTYAATLIILGPKASTCLSRAFIVFPVPTMAYRAAETETAVNMETRSRFTVYQAEVWGGKRRSQTVLVLHNWRFSENNMTLTNSVWCRGPDLNVMRGVVDYKKWPY